MTLWLIEPRDPLIVRDGRPFGPNPGARASSLDFPFPGTIAGGVRTRAGVGSTQLDGWNDDLIEAVRKIAIRGPWLVRLNDENEIVEHLLPAPADCIVFPPPLPVKDEEINLPKKASVSNQDIYGTRAPLMPIEDKDVFTNLPDDLWPIQLQENNPTKPEERVPRYWSWDVLAAWLQAPKPDKAPVPVKTWGSAGPTREARMHVSLGRDTLTAVEGALFQTSGLEFTRSCTLHPSLQSERLALAVEVSDSKDSSLRLAKVLAPFGGERRLVQWREAAARENSSTIPNTCPEDIRNAILAAKRCRVVLVTPAHFAGGYRPTAICTPCAGLTVTLKGAAVRRPQTVSGWDLAAKQANGRRGRPKATRRLAPAGSVYWVTFDSDDDTLIENWIKQVWMQCISDDETSCNDGFGLALLGTWTKTEGGTA